MFQEMKQNLSKEFSGRRETFISFYYKLHWQRHLTVISRISFADKGSNPTYLFFSYQRKNKQKKTQQQMNTQVQRFFLLTLIYFFLHSFFSFSCCLYFIFPNRKFHNWWKHKIFKRSIRSVISFRWNFIWVQLVKWLVIKQTKSTTFPRTHMQAYQ